jgi:formylglycine-generating enzyme required for sulfatase activity
MQAPSNFNAVGDDGQITLSWTPVTGATEYRIYHKSSSGVSDSDTREIVAGGDTSSHTITNLENGTAYYFKIEAWNALGAGALSGEITATPSEPTPIIPKPNPNVIFNTSGCLFHPSVDENDNIYVVNTYSSGLNLGSKLYALQSNGTQKWLNNFAEGDHAYSSVIGPEGTVYVPTVWGKIHAIGSNGTKKWEINSSGFLIGADGVFYTNSSALNPDLTKKWDFPVTGVRPVAIAFDGTIYLSGNNHIYAINPDGSKKWDLLLENSFSSIAIDADGTIYVNKQNNLLAISPEGFIKWEFASEPDGESFYLTTISVSDNTIYFSVNKRIYALNKNNTQKWFFDDEKNIHEVNIGINDTLYINSMDEIYALNRNGIEMWRLDNNSNWSNLAILENGTIYVSAYSNESPAESKLYVMQSNNGGLSKTSPWPTRDGNSNRTGQQIFIESGSIPTSAPTNLAVSTNSNTINLSWNIVENAISYRVYYSETPEISDISFSVTTSSNTISIEHLEVEKEYYFAVRGFGSGGKGPISNFAVRGGGGMTQTVQGIELVRIPAGTFMMGLPDGDSYSNESPQHQVTISNDFYMGKYEVTQKQWLAVMGAWPGAAPSSSYGVGDNHPAYNVSWTDITKVDGFLDKLNQATPGCNISGLPTDATRYHPANVPAGCFRLPTEAEWEYSARAGTTTKYYWGDGDTLADIDPYAWYSGNDTSTDGESSGTKAVGRKKTNPWGLYDMSGNVWEWVYDGFGIYSLLVKTDPAGPDSSTVRMLRGGGWNGSVDGLRSARRDNYDPQYQDLDLGFRLVLAVQR